MAIPQSWMNLGFTSGRRTYAGNKAVGGLPNSHHLTGTAADFTASREALRAQFGPKVSIIDEGDHRHVNGLSNVPYYGNRGTRGLVNGVDTSAPKGSPTMRRPTLASVMQPKMPQVPQDLPVNLDTTPTQMPMMLGDLVGGIPTVKRGGVFGSGVSLGELLANAALGFAAGMGNDAPLQAYSAAQNRKAQETFSREQWQAELAAKREEALRKAMEPPSAFQNADYFGRLPEDKQRAFLNYQDAVNPIAVSGPQGTQRVPRQLSGPPAAAIAELQRAVAQGDHAAIGEFDQVFGQGASQRYLGGN